MAVDTSTPAVAPKEVGRPRRSVLHRPEWGAFAGALIVWGIFAVIAGHRGFLTGLGTVNYLQVAAELGIVVVPVCLLMIAGEFDLSVGATVAASGVIVAYLVVNEKWDVGPAVAVAFGVALLIGLFNGLVTVRLGVPSFIVTLASHFMILGALVAYTTVLTGTTFIEGFPQNPAGNAGRGIIGHALTGFVGTVPASVFWWIGLTLVGTWILGKTAFGNWIYAAGGNPGAARNMGVPIGRVKILLFISTAFAATLLGVLQLLENGSGNVTNGVGLEFEAIAATVIGGTLLTGGYGSAIGAALGTFVFGVVSEGIFFTGINSNWFQAILGVMLLGAVLVNQVIRQQLNRARNAR